MDNQGPLDIKMRCTKQKEIIKIAPVYAEGTTFRFDVKKNNQTETVCELIHVKILY